MAERELLVALANVRRLVNHAMRAPGPIGAGDRVTFGEIDAIAREAIEAEARNPERADAKTACGHSTAATCATCDPNGIAFSVTVEGIEPDTIYDPAVWVAIRRADLKKLDVLTVTQTAGQGSHSNSQGGAT